MEKYSSNQQNKLITKSAEKQKYKELSDMLTEWFKLLYNEKSKDSVFLNKTLCWKYIVIRKFLKKHFLHNADLKKHITKLPRVWLLSSWFVEILLATCYVLLCLVNKYFFKIYIGIIFTVKPRGEPDLIYTIFLTVFLVIYFILLPKRSKMYDSLKYTLLEIYNIVGKDVDNTPNFQTKKQTIIN
jgi:hypothetical protein